MPEHQPAEIGIDDRRSSQRMPPVVEGMIIWLRLGRHIRATVLDQSNGGLGVLVAPETNVAPGSKVEVELGQGTRMAEVANVRDREDGLLRVGLAWVGEWWTLDLRSAD